MPSDRHELKRGPQSTTGVEVSLERPREDVALEETGSGIGDGQAGDLRRQLLPPGSRVDGETGIEPAGDDRALFDLGAKLRGDGNPSLVVHRMPVLAGEHRRVDLCPEAAAALVSGAARVPHFSPLRATGWHYNAQAVAVNGVFAAVGTGVNRLGRRRRAWRYHEVHRSPRATERQVEVPATGAGDGDR